MKPVTALEILAVWQKMATSIRDNTTLNSLAIIQQELETLQSKLSSARLSWIQEGTDAPV